MMDANPGYEKARQSAIAKTRPAKSKDERVQLNFRISREERNEILNAAKENDLSVEAYCIRKLFDKGLD